MLPRRQVAAGAWDVQRPELPTPPPSRARGTIAKDSTKGNDSALISDSLVSRVCSAIKSQTTNVSDKFSFVFEVVSDINTSHLFTLVKQMFSSIHQ
ncbi:Protein translocase subunit [Frankliniella fusca]|uniref:Protein translocase subunit n=1 Tax=Frankliniella fusca TaxID=407009 RepID=A0AAE1LU24_9NEOP|nr:Protein translocase subunit [Frankliniella fusca]